jgi:Putative beta-lactamase-inhibitor-like, PepSY-like
MKFLKSISILIIASMILCITNTFAQSSTTVPTTVSAAFTAKYPKADLKKWNALNGNYVAEAKNGHQKFFATFDQNGNWLNTASKISWSWNLPADVRASLRNSKYSAWRIDGIKKVDSPSTGVYQVCVDDHFLHRDGTHAGVFTNNKVLNINADGKIVAEQNISSPLLF